MGRLGKCRTHFRVVLREAREDVSGNLRRSAKGVAYVNLGDQYGEVLLAVENLRYLGTAPNGLPYHYEGWMVFANGSKVSLGPVSIDAKGNGKDYWRFVAASSEKNGVAVSDIAGFAVTVEAMDHKLCPTDLVVLAGRVDNTETVTAPPVTPGIGPYTAKQRPGGMVKKAPEKPYVMKNMPYSWWPVGMPGKNAKEAPFLFGYRMYDTGVERVAFGFPGSPDRPVLTGEVGEWLPTGTDNPYGYWVYHRKTGTGDRGKN